MKITFYDVDTPAGEPPAWVLADQHGWFPGVFASLTAAAAAYEKMLINQEAGEPAAAEEAVLNFGPAAEPPERPGEGRAHTLWRCTGCGWRFLYQGNFVGERRWVGPMWSDKFGRQEGRQLTHEELRECYGDCFPKLERVLHS